MPGKKNPSLSGQKEGRNKHIILHSRMLWMDRLMCIPLQQHPYYWCAWLETVVLLIEDRGYTCM